jgi:hypothetical protein
MPLSYRGVAFFLLPILSLLLVTTDGRVAEPRKPSPPSLPLISGPPTRPNRPSKAIESQSMNELIRTLEALRAEKVTIDEQVRQLAQAKADVERQEGQVKVRLAKWFNDQREILQSMGIDVSPPTRDALINRPAANRVEAGR